MWPVVTTVRPCQAFQLFYFWYQSKSANISQQLLCLGSDFFAGFIKLNNHTNLQDEKPKNGNKNKNRQQK
jgi:hypothetical protein